MKKSIMILIAVLVLALVVLIIFFFPKNCGGGWGLDGPVRIINCKCIGFKADKYVLDASYTSCYGICLKNTCETKKSSPFIGGCAGVYMGYWQECCENWAKENNIVHIMCVGNWTVENNTCVWKCASEPTCENDTNCDKPQCAACISTQVCSCPVFKCINQKCEEYLDTLYPNGTRTITPA